MMKTLKEWATVISALEDGEQTILLRKGGILDIASGFKLESTKFLLFPTKEHQVPGNIKEQFHHLLEQARASPQNESHNKITSYAEVLGEADIKSTKVVDKLSKFHIWSKSYINERMEWKAEKPIKALFLKVYKIPKADIPLKPEYQGCRSWIDVEIKVPDGEPVLNDAEIESRLEEFKRAVD